MRALDVACGRGAALFPAANAVGATGSVIGVDLSKGMVAATNTEIAARGLQNVSVQVMDAERLTFPDATFDALTCGFAIFFMSERGALAEFRRVLRPGGVLALSTWAPINPSSEEAARWRWHSDLLKRYQPAPPNAPASPSAPVAPSASAVETQEALAARVAQIGFERVLVHTESATFAFASPEEWWQVRWGLFYRSALEALSPPALAELQAEALAHTREMHARGELITELTAFYTIAN
jgi:ubiquinone/menaquinone biosynthesis C-methylase UbiE